MAAYAIIDVEILDEALFREFRERVTATVESRGGKFVVRGGQCDVVLGDWSPGRLAVIKFGDVDQVRTWLKSPEYTALDEMRSRSSDINMVVVAGT